MKLRGALLLVVAATVCALSGLFSPQDASASVDAVNQWPAKPTIASNSAASPVTAIYTPGMGTNRLMLVAVATEYSGAGAPAITVTYGGVAQTATQIVANTTQNSKIWLGYFTEAQIAAGSSGTKVLSVTNSVPANLTAMYASVAVYNGVNQTTPITGSGSNATASAASLLLSIPLTANAGLGGNAGLSVYVANWNGQTSTPSAGYTEVRDYAGANFNLAYCYKVIIGTTTEAPTTTSAAPAAGAAAGVSLNPAVRLATIAAGACGDCHGNPPQDGPTGTRNVLPGQFPGSHDKHAGKDEGQYGQLCTQCHRNNTTINHANALKNISGSSVPRLSYVGNGTPVSNNPTLGTCSNISCHSSGRTTKQYATSPTWGQPGTCLSCHGGRAVGGAASRSVNNFSMSTSHSQHLKYLTTEMNCQTCHGKIAASHTALKDYTGAKSHGNGSKNVNFTQIAYGSYTSFKSTASGSSANTKMCTNTACHGGTTRNPWSESGAVNANHTCTHCHGVPTGVLASNTDRKKYAPGWNGTGTSTDGISVATDVRVGAHFVHLSSIYMKQIKCNECHRVPSTPFGEATHMTGTRYNSQSVTFAQASTAIKNGLVGFTTYTAGTAVKAATCGTTYCHGTKLKSLDTAGTARKPSWNQDLTSNTPSVTVCGRCHGAPPNSVSGSHATATLSGTNSCSTCHGSVVNSSGAIINKSLHLNGIVESDSHSFPYRGSLHKDLAGATAPASNCACHDYTNAGTYPVARGTAPACRSCHTAGILRTVATVSCYDCHGSGAAATAAWPNGTVFPNNNRSHTKHSTYTAITCDYCHTGGGTATLAHGNYSGVARVQNDTKIGFSATVNGTAAAAWSIPAETCSTTKCHGSAPSPAWGAVSGKTGCAVCHGYRSASWNALDGATATTDHRAGVHFSHISSTTYKYRSRYSCLECHSGSIANTTDLITQANHFNNASSAKVEWATGTLVAKVNYANSNTPSYSPTAKTCGTVYCHGDKMPSNVSNAPATRIATPSWKTPFLTAATPTVGNGVNTPGTGNCAFCHGFPPMTSTHAGQGLATCNGCHPHVSTSGLTFLNPTLHVDGILQANGDCLSCHGGVKGARYGASLHFNYSSHHVQGRAVTNADCFQCHAEAADAAGTRSPQHTGVEFSGASIDLIVWGTGARGTSYISYTANGKREQIAKLNNHCLSCHSTPNASLAPFVAGSTTDKYSPEARLFAPKAKTSISSRYSSTRVVPWSIYNYSSATGNVSRFGTNQKNRTTKALSAHGNAAKNQMPSWSATLNGPGEDGNSTDYTYAGNSGKRNVFCYDCHNSHGSDASGITSSYSSLTKKGGMLKSTVAGFGGYDVTYKPGKRTITYTNVSGLGQGTATTTTAVFNSGAGICNDCHNNDTRKVNISKPWSITGTYSSTRAIVGYWSTPYFDNYTVTSTKRTAYKGQGTGVKARIKPMGGHYGSSVSSRSAGHSGEINGLCTPCHDPHGVSNALTTDRDHGVPLLKGTWVTSPYREDKADKLVIRGGGRNVGNFGLKGAVPGYHIDQNTFMRTPVPNSGGAGTATTRSNLRKQAFRSFSNNSSAMTGTGYPNIQAATFAGLCLECHNQASLTNTTAPGPGNWKTPARIHQSVAGWAAATGTNSGNKVHAYTCAKCHAPHVSRLPRLLVTNCLDQRHFGQSVATTISSTANVTVNAGNIIQSTLAVNSAYGAGRFPGGGSRYSNTPSSAQNPGGWWFQTNGAAGTTQSSGTPDLTGTTNATTFYGSACHNSTNSGGATYSPLNQMWNKKSTW